MKRLGSLVKLMIPHLKRVPTTPVLLHKFEHPIVDLDVGGAFALALDSNSI
jgi:hypothetical protein